MYQPRTYRHWIKDGNLVSFAVVVKETDLFIRARSNLKEKAIELVEKYRHILESYIEKHPGFATEFEPVTINGNAPEIVRAMSTSSRGTGTGPMAGVAGAIAEFVGKDLLALSPEVIVENGGDIFMKCTRKRIIGIYAGDSQLSGKIGLEINGRDTPLGICTSSGTVGHSHSYGKADAVIAISPSTTLADNSATAIGNIIENPTDLDKGIEIARKIEGLTGLVIITGSSMGAWGNVRLCSISP
mgnify:CR=1 FL=1